MYRPGNVSRETVIKLEVLCEMVVRWNRTINLIGTASIDTIDLRHIADSEQILSYAPQSPSHWLDLGSGGGFPGLVVAAHLAEQSPDCRVTLIESDRRKAVFLREASRAMRLTTHVLAERIESVPKQNADVISARALAPLDLLLQMANHHAVAHCTCLFLKGHRADHEIESAKAKGWSFELQQHKSQTEPTGVILAVGKIKRDDPNPV